MAKVYGVCKMLCVILLLISTFSSACCISDSYRYDVHSSGKNDYVSIHLKDGFHEIHKRQVDSGGTQTNKTSPTTTITTITTTTITTVPPKTNIKPVYQKKEELVKVDLEKPHKNVGVNGTGIRKNITKEEHEKTVTTPVLSVEKVNATSTESIQNATEYLTPDSDLSLDDFSNEAVNKSLKEHNITSTQHDSHQYYNSTFTINSEVGQKHWMDMSARSDVKINELLSQSHRRAATIKLSFEFPFYGHIVRNVTIATGGFLYTGEYVHSWLAATQYIAPLMANFDTSLSNDSYIKYVDNGTAFTVQWEKVYLQDKPKDGDFTFQATLHKNGDIVFVYQHVPVVIEKIQDDHHPVKVGLSDAYIIDRTVFFVRRKTIYEYHRVNFKREDIKNWTVIYLSALPTCLSNTDCNSCLTKLTGFDCMWCPGLDRCSNGMDRHRQEWLMKGCERKHIRTEMRCSEVESDRNSTSADAIPSYDTDINHEHNSELSDNPRQASRITNEINVHAEKSVGMGISGIMSILFVVLFVLGLAYWLTYAYRHPRSTSGQILIRYRPSQWRWRRGEARYTAATIHM